MESLQLHRLQWAIFVLAQTCIALKLLAFCDAKEFRAADPKQVSESMKAAGPGDTIILADGQWKDVKLVLVGEGTEENPIVVRAATPGKVVLTGTSVLRIGGKHLVVQDLLFRTPDPTVSDVIQFRKDSKQLASHCRLTNCVMIGTPPKATESLQDTESKESRWLGLYGADNEVDHCTLEGKTGKGATMVVWLGGDNVGGHRIHDNYFGPRERLGKNGGETLRIGDSRTSMLSGGCVVENNLFDRCNGEAECISNKSCDNIYRNNTFLEVSGTLTLRHGNRCLVEGNAFFGNGARGTGGIRVIGEEHVVRKNYLERLTGDDARCGITLMMGIPNSPAERYFQVQRSVIEDNAIVDCEHPILIGLSDDKNASLAPIDTQFNRNRVTSKKYSVLEVRCSTAGITWMENSFVGKSLGVSETPQGVTFATSPSPGESAIERPKAIERSDVGATWLKQ